MKFSCLLLALCGVTVSFGETAGPEVPPSAPDREEQKEPAVPARRGKAVRGPGPRNRPPFGREMSMKERQRLMYLHHLIMQKYDLNENGRLDPEEMELIHKDAERFREERRKIMLDKYDKNGDGKLDEEEKKAMREDLKAKMERRLKERADKGVEDDIDESMPPRPPNKQAGRGDDGNRPSNRPEAAKKFPEKGHRQGMKEKPGPEGIIILHGHHLMMEKFDKDGDGRLSEEELKAMREDRDAFLKEWEEKMAKRRAERKKARAYKPAAED